MGIGVTGRGGKVGKKIQAYNRKNRLQVRMGVIEKENTESRDYKKKYT